VRDPVTLLLRLQDLARVARVIGPLAHHLVEQPRCLKRVLAGLGEEVEEDPVLRHQ
jgi:hypothetical protein